MKSPWNKKHPTLSELSKRERGVLSQLLLGGHTNKLIALRLGIQEVTVKIHLKSVYRKLGVTNRTQAVLAIVEMGLGDNGDTVGALVGRLGL